MVVKHSSPINFFVSPSSTSFHGLKKEYRIFNLVLTLILKYLNSVKEQSTNMEIYKAESLPEESRVFSENILETIKTEFHHQHQKS